MTTIIPIILAGGRGTRLWPLSNDNTPKQFLSLQNQQSLLQATLQRLNYIPTVSEPIIVTHEKYRFIVAEQVKQLNQNACILLEKQQHNTAAAIALAALYSGSQHSNPILLVLPVDHLMTDYTQFSNLVNISITYALQNWLVTIGILPSSSNTEYGYIKKGNKLPNGCIGYHVNQFIEKPGAEEASAYVDSGDYFWNSGIFIFQASTFLHELQHHAPDILSACQHAIQHVTVERDFIHIDDPMITCPDVPIDKAVFEKTKRAVVLPFHGEWHDLGGWESLFTLGLKDKQDNVTSGHVLSFNTEHCFLYSTKPLLVTSGMKNCYIIATEDAVLVANRNEKLEMKKILHVLHTKKF